MSIKHHKVFPLLTIVLVHLFFICLGGYFLSTEFTVYPYLTSLGLKPYLGLIDQHLPIIFFGPLSIPKFFTLTPQPLLALFLSIVALTDLLFFHLLKKNGVPNSVFWTALFAITMFVFQGNTLWLETFIIPLVLLLLMLNETFFIGLLSALIILIRPTLAPAILVLLIFKKLKLSRSLVAGFLVPLTITLTYLVYHQLLPDFIYLFFNFNSKFYPALANQLPGLRQIALVGLVTIPALLLLIKNKKYLTIVLLILAFLPAYPRFELTHIQPAIALVIYLWATNGDKKHLSLIPKALLIVFVILSVKKISTVHYGNFYLNPETQAVSSFLKQQQQNQLFVLGGSDLIYPLSGKVPAGDYYLPSLPWYYADQSFVTRQLEALIANPQSLVVINQNSSVDGLLMQIFAKPVYGYILENYTVFHTVGSYQIYKINQ